MGADRDVRNRGVTKVPRAERPTVKLTEEGRGVSIWGALKVQRGGQTTALHMVAGDDAGIQLGAPRQHGANLGFAFGMVEGKGVRSKAALVVLRGRLACASLMEVGVVASS